MAGDGSTSNDVKIFYDIKQFIKRRINNYENEFIGDWYEKEKAEVLELFRRSVETGESNSAIICGPPGCGKTAMVNNVLKNLQSSGVLTEENSVIIRLNGLLHTDDRLTLQDIARQLKIAEFTEEAVVSRSFQENLAHLLEELKKNNAQKPCVVFILDEFHLFTEHKNQLLLYNLFDTAQSAKSPICVLGLTYYSDVMDLLEKRVLSRFSHRMIQMAKNLTVDNRLNVFQTLFTLGADVLQNVDQIYKMIWNARTKELIENPTVRQIIQQDMDLDPGEGRYRNLLFKLLNGITFEEPLLSIPKILDTFGSKDDYILILSKLSALEVALVIGIKHHTINYEREPFNFEMILAQYLKFVKNHASTLINERAVVLKAFQRLQELELIVPAKKGAGNVTGKVPLEYQLYTFSLTEEQVSEGVKLNKTISADLLQWSNNISPS